MKTQLILLATAACLAACQLVPAAGKAETQATPARTTVLPATPIRYPTLPPEWTATWTPTPTRVVPTRVPSATPTMPSTPYSQRLAAAKATIAKAASLTNAGHYTEAVGLWTQIIAQVPEYADAYYQRAVCLLNLAPAIQALTDYQAAMQFALGDVNQALSLDTRNGNYFYVRQHVYENLGRAELYRVDQDYWEALSLADLQAAGRFGTTIPMAERTTAFRLIDAGHPQEAYDQFSKLPPAVGKKTTTDADLQEGLAESQFAQGFVDQALAHIDLAIKASPSDYKTRDKALFLLSQGKVPEAFAAISQLSDGSGALCGCGRYLRALIYYRLGKPDLAQADIDAGSRETWERGGLRSYVLGLLALDRADTATGTQLLQEAQASLPRRYGPVILKQIQERLDQLGTARLDPTPHVPFDMTPMPTPP